MPGFYRNNILTTFYLLAVSVLNSIAVCVYLYLYKHVLTLTRVRDGSEVSSNLMVYPTSSPNKAPLSSATLVATWKNHINYKFNKHYSNKKKKKDPTLKRKCIFFHNFENKKSYYGNNLFACLGRRRLFCFNSYYDLLYLTWILHGMRIYLNFTFHFKGISSDEFHIKFMWSLHSKVILY